MQAEELQALSARYYNRSWVENLRKDLKANALQGWHHYSFSAARSKIKVLKALFNEQFVGVKVDFQSTDKYTMVVTLSW